MTTMTTGTGEADSCGQCEPNQLFQYNAARGEEHAIKTSYELRKIKRSDFNDFKSTENTIERAKNVFKKLTIYVIGVIIKVED